MRQVALALLFSSAWFSTGLPAACAAASPQSPPREWFEARVRPVLAEHCYRCHNSQGKKQGGLALDHRAALRRGGKSGPAIVPGKARESLLYQAVTHTHARLRMPKDSGKLDPAVLADLAKWIDGGAEDPRDAPPSKAQLAELSSWERVRDRRKQWWSMRPIARPAPPAVEDLVVQDPRWARHAIDRFVFARLRAKGLLPAARADRRTLLRRVTYALTGLPPAPAELAAFVADPAPNAYEKVVDRLLASTAYGERWARHWMDWLRYADSHGSEGDPAIHNAWRYRDYLIRALNRDVPFDRLVREHIAGDLLPDPRIDPDLGVDESRLATAHYRMVQHGFAPTDAHEEQVRFTDNQIDVLSKSFLGLTVSCARCHDHKFDAIGQDDYYALYGILVGCRPAAVVVDEPSKLETNVGGMEALKKAIRMSLGAAWEGAAAQVLTRIPEAQRSGAAKNVRHPLHAWVQLQKLGADEFAAEWRRLSLAFRESQRRLRQRDAMGRAPALGDWHRYGVGLRGGLSRPGEFHVLPAGARVVDDVLPRGIYSHLLSSKHNAVLGSPRFRFDMKSLWIRVRGDGGARARYVVHHYPRGGTVYPIHRATKGTERWVRWDATYWKGDQGHLELSTAADQAVEASPGATRSWFGITRAVFTTGEDEKRGAAPRDEMAEFLAPLFEGSAPRDAKELAALYTSTLRRCARAFAKGEITDAQARFLGAFVRGEMLPSKLEELSGLRDLVAKYRALEQAVPVPRRAPGILEPESHPQPLFVRGDHKSPGAVVPPRFLAAIDPTPYGTKGSARLRLADDFVRKDNPLTARVAVNRLWHHVFGRGLVATPDNFGKLGELPTHPELLDWLAQRFLASGWSVKKTLRLLVTSETFCLASERPEGVDTADPKNRLWSHAQVRRLEAEALRDALLTAGGLDRRMYGPSESGGSRRRSIYVRVKRNDLDPFLTVFDAPDPHTTRGRRAVTNVPAQSLTMLNGRFVIDQAGAWAGAVLGDRSLSSDEERVRHMFLTAFGRPPREAELTGSRAFLARILARSSERDRTIGRLREQKKTVVAQLASVFDPVRQRLVDALDASRTGAQAGISHPPVGPAPIACWEFEGDLKDSVGGLHGVARAGARVKDGALELDGRGYVETAPLSRDLAAKTLEAWVQLRDLRQRGGGVVTVQTRDGGVFDALVFGEKDPGQWLPGSDFFNRTRSLRAPPERDAGTRPVHVAITYGPRGMITAYRDGQQYGKAYPASSPVAFRRGRANVIFGLRHGPASAGKLLKGRILRARLYDRALSAAEVEASFRSDRTFVSEKDVMAALTAAQRKAVRRLRAELAKTDERLAALAVPAGYRMGRERAWQDFAQCLFNSKEFLYLR